MKNTLEIVAGDGPDVDQMARAESPAVWNEYETKLVSLRQSADAVLKLDPANPESSKLARVARLSLRSVRIDVEAKRKELTEFHLRKKQSIDSEAKTIKEAIEEYENKLKAIEDHAERVEAERLAKLRSDREAEMRALGWVGMFDLATLSDDDFAKMLAGQKGEVERIEAEKKAAEEARIAKEKAEAEERERLRKENEAMRAAAEAREKEIAAERERVEKARKEAEEKARKEREAIEAKAKAEREEAERKAAAEKAEADRLAKIEREKIEVKAREEREAREKAEAEIARQKKAEEDRIAEEERKKAEAAAAPDKEKLIALAEVVRAIEIPEFATTKFKNLAPKIRAAIDELATKIATAGGKAS